MAQEWRTHPSLAGRFLEGYPDDLQVIIHEGGPRLSPNPPELVWVRLNAMGGDVFRGTLLNQPAGLATLRLGMDILLFMPDGSPHPILVTEKYLRERMRWLPTACTKCGMTELFDAPSDYIRAAFPNVPTGAKMKTFTAHCPLCDGFVAMTAIEGPDGV